MADDRAVVDDLSPDGGIVQRRAAASASLDSPARRLLWDLVVTPSPSGEEADAATVLAAFLSGQGREVWIDEVGNVRSPAPNTPLGEDVLLTSHIDTVPGEVTPRVTAVDPEEARWGHNPVPEFVAADDGTGSDGASASDRAGASDRSGGADVSTSSGGSTTADSTAIGTTVTEVPELWGRGSVDATGPLVAMAVAAAETGASFVGVVGEETSSRGARHLVDDRPAPAAVVNGEPSGWDAVTLGYRGFLAGEYTVETAAGHSSRPEPNAVQYASNWWHRVASTVVTDGGALAGVDRYAAVPGATESDGDAGETDGGAVGAPTRAGVDDQSESPPDSGVFESVTATPVTFEGGPTEDGHAIRATVEAQFRIPPGSSAAEIRERVESLTEYGSLSWGDSIPPTTASPRTPLARAFRVAIRQAGGDPSLLRKTGTADANLYDEAWDVPVVTYGPGDSALDHTAEERLPLPALDCASDVLVAAVDRIRRGQ